MKIGSIFETRDKDQSIALSIRNEILVDNICYSQDYWLCNTSGSWFLALKVLGSGPVQFIWNICRTVSHTGLFSYEAFFFFLFKLRNVSRANLGNICLC
jgi:hypothetical protein